MYKHLKYETWKNSSKTISISFKSSIYLLLIQNFQLKNHNPPLFERKKSYQTYLLLYISFGLSVIHKRVNNTVLFIVIFESKYMYFRSTENLMKQHSKRIFWRKKFLTLLCKVIFYRWKLFKIRHEMSIKQGWYKKKRRRRREKEIKSVRNDHIFNNLNETTRNRLDYRYFRSSYAPFIVATGKQRSKLRHQVMWMQYEQRHLHCMVSTSSARPYSVFHIATFSSMHLSAGNLSMREMCTLTFSVAISHVYNKHMINIKLIVKVLYFVSCIF